MSEPARAHGFHGPKPQPAWKRRFLAGSAGLLCHGTFVVAVTALAIGLYDGMTSGRARLGGTAGLAWNTLLALQFPLLHSSLLTARGRAALGRLLGRRHGRDLAPTAYSAIAALQILATFLLWSPSGTVWWKPEGPWLAASCLAYGAAWIFLLKALYDAGPGLQTGYIGWSAVWRGERVRYPAMAQRGLFQLCRQPIYLGFALTLWTGPVWTPDRLLLASIWTAYCVLGPRHKERRYAAIYGEEFRAYQKRVVYMSLRRRGAA